MKKISIALFLICCSTITAQKKSSNWNLGLDIQSRYVWRGIQFGGASPSIQPYIEYVSSKFTFGTWGAYSLGGTNTSQEVDLYIIYDLNNNLSISITDYFFSVDGNGNNNNYINLGNKTNHVFEAGISFSGVKSFPIGISISTNFAGASTGSTYIELNYKTKSGIELFAGGVFNDNKAYYFTKGTGLINLGISKTKNIKITQNFNLPINTSLVINPDAENVYLTVGISL